MKRIRNPFPWQGSVTSCALEQRVLRHERRVVQSPGEPLHLAADLAQPTGVGLLEPDLEVALLADAAGAEARRLLGPPVRGEGDGDQGRLVRVVRLGDDR